MHDFTSASDGIPADISSADFLCIHIYIYKYHYICIYIYTFPYSTSCLHVSLKAIPPFWNGTIPPLRMPRMSELESWELHLGLPVGCWSDRDCTTCASEMVKFLRMMYKDHSVPFMAPWRKLLGLGESVWFSEMYPWKSRGALK